MQGIAKASIRGTSDWYVPTLFYFAETEILIRQASGTPGKMLEIPMKHNDFYYFC